MVVYGGIGDNRLLYGVIIRDKMKTADEPTLRAYLAVGKDLLKGPDVAEAGDLEAAVADLEKRLGARK